MSDITTLLEQIKIAIRGDEVRDSIHDAIYQCYIDGRAGAIDLGARGLIESVIRANEEQESDIDDLQGRVLQLEEGSGEGTTETTTTTFDTCKMMFGNQSLQVNGQSVIYTQISLPVSGGFATTPFVGVFQVADTSASIGDTKISVGVKKDSVSPTRFSFYVVNSSTTQQTVYVDWIAIAPVIQEINTDITIPASDDLTEEQIQSIEGLFD